jgi:gamma-glutamyltranspeptidase / glutathione hydrolase
MTDRWLNYVLAVVVVLGLAGVTIHERPRLAEERARFLDQEVRRADDLPPAEVQARDPLELRRRQVDPDEAAPSEHLHDHGVSASHPAAVTVGLEVLDGGGNAIDAAVAVAYALGVVEPFGSGIGGGGMAVIHRPDGDPVAYDYRETAPASGEVPASNIGVPGFVLGMERLHDRYGTIELSDLIEPAARLAEDGVEVDGPLNGRLRGAAHRMPIHLVPGLFPNGTPIAPGQLLRQPEYAEALRMIQRDGADAVYRGALGEQIVDAVSGIEREDLQAYEVLEVQPAIGHFAGHDIVSGGPPTSGASLVQSLQISEQLGVTELDPASAEGHHAIAQSWRIALSDRTLFVADPSLVDVPLDRLLDRDYTDRLAALIPADGFVAVEADDPALSFETDTTHVVVVDRQGTMVSMTNTLSNFFGSGLPVSGFFLNDQLKNFSADEDSVNAPAPGKRPRSFVAPTIVARDGRPVLGIGSPGGRRIPMMIAQVIIRWAGHGQDLATATAAPRFHLEGQRLEVEEPLDAGVVDELARRGYQVTTDVPTTEYYGGMQALLIDHDAGTLTGIADERRAGAWDAASR